MLSSIFGEPVEVHGSGRTDAGVHARGQVASFRAPERPTELLLRELRRYLPEDIGALSLQYAQPRFHARLSALEKTYVYRVWNSEMPDVFGRRWRVQLPAQLDLETMRAGAGALLGTHDFRAFCANRQLKKSSVRTLHRCEIVREGEELRFVLTADGGGNGSRKGALSDGGTLSMNIQVFGKSKCFDTKKAERYFKERRIKFQSIDLKRYGMSNGEFESVLRAVGGVDQLIDWGSKDPDVTLMRYLSDERAKEDKLFERPELMKTPVVRNGKKATAGYCPEVWKEWEENEK